MNTTVKLNSQNNTRQLLHCPVCGDEYLHHHKMKFLESFQDDWDSGGMQTLANGHSVTMERVRDEESHKIPGRRGAILIYFSCENCQAGANPKKDLYILGIIQHKGQTFMQWVTEDEKGKIEW